MARSELLRSYSSVMQTANITQECAYTHGNGEDPRIFFISKLKNALRRRINSSKAPIYFEECLAATCETDDSDLLKTLLEADILVWIAYFLADENLEGLKNLSAGDLTFVIAEVVNAPRDDTIDQFTKHFVEIIRYNGTYKAMLEKLRRKHAITPELPAANSYPFKRPRNLSTANINTSQGQGYFMMETETMRIREHSVTRFQEHSTTIVEAMNDQEQPIACIGATHDQQHFTVDMNVARKREQFTVHTDTMLTREHSAANTDTLHTQEQFAANLRTTVTPEQSATRVETSHDREHSRANDIVDNIQVSSHFKSLYKSIGFGIDNTKHMIWPSASRLSSIFPMSLIHMVAKRDDGKAWVRITFSTPASSVLEVFITASETPYVAKELFDINITTEDRSRSIFHDSGVSQRLEGSISLSGAPTSKVAKLLGTLAEEAFQSTPKCAKEASQGFLTITKCLTMQIWSDSDSPSLLTLRADVNILRKMAAQMWPKYCSC